MGYLFLILSAVGLFDSAFLTARHYQGIPVVCSLFKGCEIVTSSAYSVVLGVPVALFGAVYYFAIFILAAVAISRASDGALLRRVAWLTPLGFIASAWFFYVQAFILNAYCLYCLISAATSTLLFILGILVIRREP